MIGDPPRADRVVLRFAGRPGCRPRPGPRSGRTCARRASWPACRLDEDRAKNTLEVFLRAGLRGADGADDLGRPAVHAGRALRRRGRQDQPSHDGRPDQRDLLRDEAADGEPEHVDLAEFHGGDERDGVAGHLLHDVAAYFPVEPPTPALSNVMTRRCRGQRVDQRGIPVVQVPAEVLQEHQRHRALAAGVAVRVVDAVRGADQLVREARVSTPSLRSGHSDHAV